MEPRLSQLKAWLTYLDLTCWGGTPNAGAMKPVPQKEQTFILKKAARQILAGGSAGR